MASRPGRRTHGAPDRRHRHADVDLLLGEVLPLGLQEDHRVGVVDRRAQQPVGVGVGRRGDHVEAGGVRVVRLGGVAVVLDAADAAAVGDADDHRQPHRAPGAVAHLGDVADDLLERRVGEGVELHLDHRAHSVHRHPDGHPDDAGLGQRGVEAAVLAEVLGQPVGDPEDAAERTDVLAEHDDPLVARSWRRAGRCSAPGPSSVFAIIATLPRHRARPAAPRPARAAAAVGVAYTWAKRSVGIGWRSRAPTPARTAAAMRLGSRWRSRPPARRSAPPGR